MTQSNGHIGHPCRRCNHFQSSHRNGYFHCLEAGCECIAFWDPWPVAMLYNLRKFWRECLDYWLWLLKALIMSAVPFALLALAIWSVVRAIR